MGLVIFSQNFGGALSLAFAQTAFNSGLRQSVPEFAPSIGAQTVIEAGAGHVREAVPKAAVGGGAESIQSECEPHFLLGSCICGDNVCF